MSDYRDHMVQATATLMEMIGLSIRYTAAVIRGAGQAELEQIRGQGHDMMDAYLDRSAEAARKVVDIAADHPARDALAELGAKRLIEP